MKTKVLIVAMVSLFLASLLICGIASAFRDDSLRGQDNPMDNRNEYDKMSQWAGPVNKKDLLGAADNSPIRVKLPDGKNGQLVGVETE